MALLYSQCYQNPRLFSRKNRGQWTVYRNTFRFLFCIWIWYLIPANIYVETKLFKTLTVRVLNITWNLARNPLNQQCNKLVRFSGNLFCSEICFLSLLKVPSLTPIWRLLEQSRQSTIYYCVSGIVMKPVRLLCYIIFFKSTFEPDRAQRLHSYHFELKIKNRIASRCLLSMVCPRMGEWGMGTHAKFDIFSFQLSVSPSLDLHFESNSHPQGKPIGTHNSLYCSTERLQREIITRW